MILCVCSAGCIRFSTPAERDASFSAYQAARVGEPSLQEFLLARSAVLLGADKVSPAPSGTNFRYSSFTVWGTNLWRGAAAAIDRRGYFVTAAHCVGAGPAVWLVFPSGRKMQVEPARVVWRGDISKNGPDLALLKVSRPLEQVFEWGTEFTAGSPVLAVGVTADKLGAVTRQCMGGEVLRLAAGPERVPPRSTIIQHNLPLRPGDSGGPLVAHDGRLLGINYAGRIGLQWWPPSVRTVCWNAERPDLEWFGALIEQDAALQSRVP